MDEQKKKIANPQPTSADEPPIPQPPTDGFPAGEDLTSRVPGGDDEVKEEHPPE